MSALIFDCDGVLAETERDGHLPAYNQMFAEFALPAHWTVEEYAEPLQISGGRERLVNLLSADFVRAANLPVDPLAQQALVDRWHRRKTALYVERVRSGLVAGWPGVVRLVDEALRAGWQLAVASASAMPAVQAVLTHVVGPERAERFAIFAGEIVARKKPPTSSVSSRDNSTPTRLRSLVSTTSLATKKSSSLVVFCQFRRQETTSKITSFRYR